jgi:hypothetical protein
MAAHLRAAITRVKCQLRTRLPVDVDQLARQMGHRWRDRKLTPAVTVWLFLLQVLHGNCAITALRHLSGVASSASSYCAARVRLPLAVFVQLFDAVAQMARVDAAVAGCAVTLLDGRRVVLGDSTTYSTPDSAELRRHFRYPPDQRPGCGFPVGRLLAVIDAGTGAALMAMGCPLFAHDARSMLQLHPLLQKGDILVGDRAFCSYAQVALLLRGGVDVVLHLHQKRALPAAKDSRQIWTRWRDCPDWMEAALWRSLPPELSIRVVRYAVPRRGYRTRVVYVATTLLDALAYPPQTIARLYGHRWNIETCFNQLKTHAKMNTLKCQTLDGVIKELIMYLIVWNLVRMTMARFARRVDISAWRVSFMDSVRWLCRLLTGAGATELKLLINPDRAGRWEPRKLKRRLKFHDMLAEPRQHLKSKHRARYA